MKTNLGFYGLRDRVADEMIRAMESGLCSCSEWNTILAIPASFSFRLFVMCNCGTVKVLHCITYCIKEKGGPCVTLRQGIAPNNASVGPWEGVQGFTRIVPLFAPSFMQSQV